MDNPGASDRSSAANASGSLVVLALFTLLAGGVLVVGLSGVAIGDDIPVGEGTTFEASEDGPTITLGEGLLLSDPFVFPDGQTIDLDPHATITSEGDTTATLEQATGAFTNLTTTDVAAGLTVDPSDKQAVTVTGTAVSRTNFSDVDASVAGETELVYDATESFDITLTELPETTEIHVVDDGGETMTSETTDGDGVATFELDAGEQRVGFQSEDAESLSVAVAGTNNFVTDHDELTVTAEVTNDGSTKITDDVTMVVDDDPVGTETVTLEAGERTFERFAYAVAPEDIGDLPVEVQTDGDDAMVADVRENVPVDLAVDVETPGLEVDGETTAVVSVRYLNGTWANVTTAASLQSADDSVVSTDGSTLTGEGDGTTDVIASYEGFDATAPVGVSQDAPIVANATVTEETPDIVSVSFDRTVDLTATDPRTGFELRLNGTPVAIEVASVEGNSVSLTLASAVRPGQELTLSYDESTENVRSDDGVPAIGFADQRVLNEAPRTEIAVDPAASSYAPAAGSNVTFQATGIGDVYDRAFDPTYEWSVEGEEIATVGPEIDYQLPTDLGSVEATVTVRALGTSTTGDVSVGLEDRTPPTARLSVDASAVDPGETVTFDAGDSSDTVAIANYSWTFGDGTELAADPDAEEVSHSFDTYGHYDVQVTVTDTSGNVDTATATVTVTAPNASVDRQAIDFGEVPVGSGAATDLTITNDGTVPLEVDAALEGPDATAYASEEGPHSVDAGGERSLRVAFEPDAATAREATLSLETNATDPADIDIALEGTGIDSDVVPLEDSRSIEAPAGETETMAVAFENVGGVDTTLSTVETAGADHFAVEGYDEELPAGETAAVTVSFAPTAVETATGTLAIETASGDVATVSLEGTGTGPALDVPATLAIGDVGVGETETATVEIHSVGTAPVAIESVNVDGSDDLSVTATPDVIAAGETDEIVVEFAPTTATTVHPSLQIEHNGTETAQVDITATGTGGTIGLSTRVLDFGNTPVDVTVTRNLTIENTAEGGELRIDSANIVGAHADDFRIDRPAALADGDEIVIQPGDQRDIELNATASAWGEREAQLQIASTAENDGFISVWLTNTGSFVIVEEISNPTVNVAGTDLTPGRQYGTNVSTASTLAEPALMTGLTTVLPDGGDFETEITHAREPPDDVSAIDTDDDREAIQYYGFDAIDLAAVDATKTNVSIAVDTGALLPTTDPEDIAIYQYDPAGEQWDRRPTTPDGFSYRTDLATVSPLVVTVPAPNGQFHVTELDSPESVGTDGSVTIEYGLENTGEVLDTRTVTLSVDGEVIDSHGVELAAGASTTGSFTFEPDGESGERTLAVSSGDDTATITLSVEDDTTTDTDGTGIVPVTGDDDDGTDEGTEIGADPTIVEAIPDPRDAWDQTVELPATPADETITIVGPGHGPFATTESLRMEQLLVQAAGKHSISLALEAPEIHRQGPRIGREPAEYVSDFEQRFGTVPAGYLRVEHGPTAADIDTVTIRFAVNQSLLERLDVGAETLQVRHLVGDEWRERPTSVVNDTDWGYELATVAPRFSVFAIDTSADQFAVESASLSKESVKVGEETTLAVEVTNRGAVLTEMELALTADGEVWTTEMFTVEPGTTATDTIDVTMEESGEFDLAVDGEMAGTLKVVSRSDEPEDGTDSEDNSGETADGDRSATDSLPYGPIIGGSLVAIGLLVAVYYRRRG